MKIALALALSLLVACGVEPADLTVEHQAELLHAPSYCPKCNDIKFVPGCTPDECYNLTLSTDDAGAPTCALQRHAHCAPTKYDCVADVVSKTRTCDADGVCEQHATGFEGCWTPPDENAQ